MKLLIAEKGLPALVAVLGVVAITVWIKSYNRDLGIKDRPLGVELIEQKKEAGTPLNVANNQGSKTTVNPSAVIQNIPGSWSGFRGENYDNVSTDTTSLARSWPGNGPQALWSVNLGEGYAAPAVRNGRVFVLDYDVQNRADVLRCFSLANGGEVWNRSYPVVVKRNHGMSRTVPAVNDKYVVSLGPKCHLLCCDPATGKEYWIKDLVAEFDVTVPQWYAGECPIIDGNNVVIGTGGKALMVAFDLATGKVAWQTPNPRGWKMTHSTILPMKLGSKSVYVWCADGGIAVVNAKDGSLLWDTEDWKVSTATVPTPVSVGGGKLFICGGYDSGAIMLQLKDAGAKVSGNIVFRIPSSKFGSEQQTPIFYKDHLYGVSSNKQLICLDLNGNVKWSSGSTATFGLGPYVIADGLIYVMDDKGNLTMAEASPNGYKPLATARVLQGPDAWGPMVPIAGRLLCRDLTRMVCLDVSKK